MRAVTTRARAWRVAAAPAAESISFMISPPCTLPYGLASEGSIIRDITVFELATVFASSGTRAILSLASPRDRSLSRGASRRPRGLTASRRRSRSARPAPAERSRPPCRARAAVELTGSARRGGHRPRACGPRGCADRQGRLVGSAPGWIRDHLLRTGQSAERPHRARASALEPASIGCDDPGRGLGPGLLGTRRGPSLCAYLAWLSPATL